MGIVVGLGVFWTLGTKHSPSVNTYWILADWRGHRNVWRSATTGQVQDVEWLVVLRRGGEQMLRLRRWELPTCLQSVVRRQSVWSCGRGLSYWKGVSLIDWDQLLAPLLTSCEIWGRFIDHFKPISIKWKPKGWFLRPRVFVKMIIEYL